MNLHRPIVPEQGSDGGRDPRARARAGRGLPADGVAAGARAWALRRGAERRRRRAGARAAARPTPSPASSRGCGASPLRSAASIASRRSAFCRHAAGRVPHRRERSGRRAYASDARRGDLRELARARCSIRSSAATAIPSPTAPIAARASRSSPAFLTTAPRRRWRRSPCARPAAPSIATPPTAAFTPRPSPATTCGPKATARALRRAGGELRPALHARRCRCRVRPAAEGRDRRHQGARRLSARLRRDAATTPWRGLRQLKRRDAKPFALMARDLDIIRRYCAVGRGGGASAHEPGGADRAARGRRAGAAARGHRARACTTLGFMLPTTPLHLLMLQTHEPPGGDDQRQSLRRAAGHRRRRDAHERLAGIAALCADPRPGDRQPHRRFGGARHGRACAAAAPRARLCAGADRAPAGLRGGAGACSPSAAS